MDYKCTDDAFIAHTYKRYDLCFTHGEGCHLFDIHNKKYIDFTSGIGVTSMGHAHPTWVRAIQTQAATLAHVSNLYYTQPMLEVASILIKRTQAKKVFFTNSGAEANEGAIKVARKYAFEKYGGTRDTIITLRDSFHGRTITTLSATGQDSFHTNFAPFTPGFTHALANDIDDLKRHINARTAAIMIEIVQGEGGVIPLTPAYLTSVQTLCDEHDIVLIIDEVQTGIGRCGTLFAYEQYDLHPAIVCSAKGLGNGLPIGAFLLFDKCEHTLQYGDHGTTFGGNPIACAGAQVVLEHIDDALLQTIRDKGLYIRNRLAQMPHVDSVQGLGLMLGVTLTPGIDVQRIIQKCMEKGVLFLSAKHKLRLLPPLIIDTKNIDNGLDILESVLMHEEAL